MRALAEQEEARRGALARGIDSLTDRLIALRRDIHAHPEVGNAEFRTTAVIVDELERAGLVVKVLPIGTGAYCDVLPNGTGYAEGLLGIRADIDALPITDAKDVPYASQNPGVCHACGHDVHTAIVMGLGMVLARLREDDLLPRGVRLIFQPAEEASPGGALDAIDGGVLQDVTEIYALHCDPRTDVGQIALKVGPITSAVDQVTITLNGVGGHTSRPASHPGHRRSPRRAGHDVPAGAVPPGGSTQRRIADVGFDPRRFGGQRDSGHRPDRGYAAGARRCRLAARQAADPPAGGRHRRPFGVEVEVAVTDGVPPAVNRASGIRRLIRASERALGPNAVASTEQSLGGEDFSWMLQQVPGALARLGVRTPGESCPDIHQPTFRVDEACIGVGLRLLAEVATTH